jgi:dTDP-4-amino-4,6-dideoxygalactose transaminase
VSSGTAALHLALEALQIGPGDKVIVPTMTFTATAEVIRYLDADPVFVDVEYGTCLVTPELLEEAIARTPGAKAAMVVHFGGQAASMLSDGQGGGLLDVCREHGLKLVEDAAHAFPTRLGGHLVGSFGDATCFSFYANKTITTGEGGMLVTDDEALFERARLMRLHGMNRDMWDRFTSSTAKWEYDVVAPGFKYNLPDILAAVGLAQLEGAEELRRGRQRCAAFYYEHLQDVAALDLPVCHGSHDDHSWHLFCIVLNDKSPVERNRFIELMSAAGVGTSVHYKPLHRMSYYQERYGLRPDDFPNAERHWRGAVSLPIYPSLTSGELDYICSTVRGILRDG